MAKIADAIIYYNEIELFAARYETLKDVVDYFCVFESTQSFTGRKKPNTFFGDLDAYGLNYSKDKIRYYGVGLLPTLAEAEATDVYRYELSMVSRLGPSAGDQWFKEHLSRELLKHTLVDLPDDCIVLVSDADEIPIKGAIGQACELLTKNSAAIISFEMEDYVGSVACRTGKIWEGSYAVTKDRALKLCLSEARKLNPLDGKRDLCGLVRIPDAGWHFSSFGGADVVEEKIMAWGHQELNRWDIRLFLRSNLALCRDIFGRDIFSGFEKGAETSARQSVLAYFAPFPRQLSYIAANPSRSFLDLASRCVFVTIQTGRRVVARLAPGK